MVRLGGGDASISSACCSTPSKSPLLATIFTLAIAIPGAWAIARYRLPLKSVLIGAILFPRMIPEITFALGVARIFYATRISPTPPPASRSRTSFSRRRSRWWCWSAPSRVWTRAAGSRRGAGLRTASAVPAGDAAAGAARHRRGGAVFVPRLLQRLRADADGLWRRYGDACRCRHTSRSATAILSVAAAISTILLIPSLFVPHRHAADGEPGKPARRAERRMTEVRLALEHIGKALDGWLRSTISR